MHRLFDLLFPPRVDERVLRDVSCEEFLAALRPLLVPYTRPGTVALFSFDAPTVRATLHEAKYHGSPRAFAYFGLALADYLNDLDDTVVRTTSNIILVPVPLGTARQKKRGFNQVEEVIRKALPHLATEQLFSVETELLVRTRETPSQVSLPRTEREKNMRDAFCAQRAADPTATYIIIDDVLTTGATLQAAIDALRVAGALEIIPIALAHA